MDVLYPPVCGACNAPLSGGREPVQGVLCPDCAQGLEPLDGQSCPRCAAPVFEPPGLSGGMGSDDGRKEPNESCRDCARLRPAFVETHAAWLYGGPLLEAIHALKYDRQAHLARPFGRLLAASLPEDIDADAIVPVPSHPKRVRERGFDQTVCLSDEVARATGISCNHRAVRRGRNTAHQARLGLEGRLENLKGAFAPASNARDLVEGRRVLLIDDVMTSGATAHSCAEVLLEAGAKSVVVAVIARAG